MESPEITAETLKNLEVQLETHIFTCIKYKDTPDAGFTSNLWLLLEAVEHSDKVTDEGIKLIAKGLLSSVINHQIQKHDMEEVNDRLLKFREKQATEAAEKKATESE
jgi:hypothetical protein